MNNDTIMLNKLLNQPNANDYYHKQDVRYMAQDTSDETDKLDKLFSKANIESCANCKECCCKSCAVNVGYFRIDNGLPGIRILRTIMSVYKFDEKKGFLTDTGCALPRGIRSAVCLGHTCGKLRLTEYQYNVIRKMIIKIRAIRFMKQLPV